MTKIDPHILVDHTFRNSYGRLVSNLVARFGFGHLDLIEDAVMEAFTKALKVWSFNGIPDQPEGWLYRTSKNALIDRLKNKHHAKYVGLDGKNEPLEQDQLDHDDIVADPELKLLFTICHPAIKPEDRLAFMLKTLSGFGLREIASSLLEKEETIKKRLVRSRKQIKARCIDFDFPQPDEIPSRLVMVHHALYLLFNEGYYPTHPTVWLRKDLCIEALRLTKQLVEHRYADHNSRALMSLMCYHIARLDSRFDSSGQPVLLENQDRSKYDTYFINLGNHFLEASFRCSEDPSVYKIEAVISSQHCMAKTFDATNWRLLKVLYTRLLTYKDQPLVCLNLVVVLLQLKEVEAAKSIYESLTEADFTGNLTYYYATGADLYQCLNDKLQIKLLAQKVAESRKEGKEWTFLMRKFKSILNIQP